MASPDLGRDDDLAIYQTILDTLSGPRIVWHGGEPTVDMSAFDRPFAPALAPSADARLSRRRTA